MIYDRNLASIQNKLLKGSSVLQSSIRERLAGGGPVSVLEVGCGEGVALIELALCFRNAPVRFHAINKERGEPLGCTEDLVRVALRHRLVPAEELRTLALPALSFYDATRLRFADNEIDVIYSSSVLRYIPDKAQFIEEVCRVLKPGGIALLRLSSGGWKYPYSLADRRGTLTPYPSRLVLQYGNELIPLDVYFRRFPRDGYQIDFINLPSCVIRIQKHRAAPPSLGLRYDPAPSGPMQRLPYADERLGLPKGGFRSVYDVPEEQYRELVACGLLDGRALRRRSRVPRAPQAQASAEADDSRGFHKRLRRLSRYQTGQRVVVKIRREGRARACVVKMKMGGSDGLDHLQGELTWLDARRRSFRVLDAHVFVGDARPSGADGSPVALSDIRPGVLAKVDVERENGRLVARRLIVDEQPAKVVEQIHGRILEIDHSRGVLVVAGVAARVTPRSKIDESNRR
jgi:SAM-dependent methyltransferase